MAEPNAPQGWWHTLPGILTATAAVITAVTGLAVVLYQNGAFGGSSAPAAQRTEASASPAQQPNRVPPGNAAPAGPPDANAGTPGGSAPGGGAPGGSEPEGGALASPAPNATPRPWAESEAVVTARDGVVARLGAATVNGCYHAPILRLVSGQEVGFERMRGFELLEAPAVPNAPVPIVVTLLSGRTVRDHLETTCSLSGANDIGRFELSFERLKRVEFVR